MRILAQYSGTLLLNLKRLTGLYLLTINCIRHIRNRLLKERPEVNTPEGRLSFVNCATKTVFLEVCYGV